MQKENRMGVAPVPGLIVTMAVPIMISMVVQSMYNIVDSIFVARISEGALTAASLAYSAQMLQIAVAVGTGVGANALVSRCLSAKRQSDADEAAATGLVLTLLSSLVFVIWGLAGSRAFIAMFTDDAQILADGTAYLQICQVFSTGIFLATFYQRMLQATGRTVSSMLAQMAGALANLILDPIMIFGYFGCLAMGVAGAQAQREEAYRQKILQNFFEYGRLTTIPAQRKKRRICLEEIARAFEVGKPYAESEVNDIIGRYHEDYCTLRREMICEGIMERSGGDVCEEGIAPHRRGCIRENATVQSAGILLHFFMQDAESTL